MTDPKQAGRFLDGSAVKYDPATLTPPRSANFADVSTVNGNIYLDFAYMEYLIELERVEGVSTQSVQLVSRLVLSPDTCMQVIGILTETLRRMGIIRLPDDGTVMAEGKPGGE